MNLYIVISVDDSDVFWFCASLRLRMNRNGGVHLPFNKPVAGSTEVIFRTAP